MKDKQKVKDYNKKYWKKAKADPIKAERIRRSSRLAVKRYYERNEDKIREYRKQRKLRLRFLILKESNFSCQYCGRKAPDIKLHIDHKIPASKGGSNKKENLIVACADCNMGKGDILLESIVSSQ